MLQTSTDKYDILHDELLILKDVQFRRDDIDLEKLRNDRQMVDWMITGYRGGLVITLRGTLVSFKESPSLTIRILPVSENSETL